MRNTSILAIAFAIISSIDLLAQDVKKWTLQECVDYAYSQNLDVKLAELNMHSEQSYLKQAQFSRVPTLNFNLFQNWRFGRSIDPTTNQFISQQFSSNGISGSSEMVLFNGLSQYNQVRQSQRNVEASYYDLEKAKNDVALNVVAGYLEVIFARELLENARFQSQNTQAQLERTKLMVEAGSLPITNLLDLQAQMATNEVNIVTAENDLNLAVLRLKQFLQIPASEPFDIVAPEFEMLELAFLEENVEEVYETAEQTMPEVKSAEVKMKSALLAEKVAKGGVFPSLAVQGQVATNYANTADVPGRPVFTGDSVTVTEPIGLVNNDPNQVVLATYRRPVYTSSDGYPVFEQWNDNLWYSIGFNLRIPILNGLQVKTNRQIAKIQYERAKVNATQTRNTLRTTIETSYNNALAASKTYSAAEKQVEALEEAFRATEKRYTNQAGTYVEYQVATNNLYAAKSDLSRAKYDYIFRLKVLDFYLGKPITLDE